ncbi:DUF58 domain-containing protein [Alkalihalobacillus sp. LMS39]|uniref:DUF58 domain-containing protein n=1 Tax=Alkalihalobacillus sp. LMS39 TaxID=2924032 RepID=UPI001FB1D513|nr:DUF58 domain-containing protein [Alkalihalobacillus sp. LMS39]UOE94465.1 DUF58 domain-containing protein [Alkalihalobacillus sp. LMS39]
MKSPFSKLMPYIKPLLLLIVNGLVFAYAMFQGGFVSWFLFYSVFVLSLLSCSVIFVSFRSIEMEREITPDVAVAEESVDVTIRMKKRFFHPFYYVRVHDVIPKTLSRAKVSDNGGLFFFSFNKTLTFEYKLFSLIRGEHDFQEVEVVVGDLFGFFERKKRLPLKTTMVIYPRYEKLNRWTVFSSRGNEEGSSFEESFEEELSISSIRNYIPGDRLTSIDWKHSARSNKLMTKEFESYQGQASNLAFYPVSLEDEFEAFEQAVVLCASIVNFYYKKAMPLGFLDFDEQGQYTSPSEQHSQYQTIYRQLATVTPKKDELFSITPVVELMRGTATTIISVSLTPHLSEMINRMLSVNGKVMVCLIKQKQSDSEEMNRIEKLRSNGVRVFQFMATNTDFENEQVNES